MDIFRGRITSSGFSSGDRIVIGDWQESKLGSFTNVMVAKSDGTRLLFSPSKEHAELVSNLYNFEEVRIVDLEVERREKSISVKAGDLHVSMSWGFTLPIPFWRPLWFVATVEAFFGRLLFGTKTHGRTKNQRKAWYSVRSLSRVSQVEARLGQVDLGERKPFENTACFGFSEPPKVPASVSLKTYIS